MGIFCFIANLGNVTHVNACMADIIKVRMQATQAKGNMTTIARHIWTNEGPLAFYKVNYS